MIFTCHECPVPCKLEADDPLATIPTECPWEYTPKWKLETANPILVLGTKMVTIPISRDEDGETAPESEDDLPHLIDARVMRLWLLAREWDSDTVPEILMEIERGTFDPKD